MKARRSPHSRPDDASRGGGAGSARLDLALIARHPELSRRRAREVIEKGQVSVEGEIVREPGRAVAQDQAIDWNPNRKALSRARLSLPRLYEDEDVLIVDKPAGLLSVPTSGDASETEDSALARVADYARHRGAHAPYVGRVHRLDRDTSGALAFALSPEARQGLIALFRDHRIERVYLALVRGEPATDAGVVDAPIRDTYVSGRRGVARPGEAASQARTGWRIRERLGPATLLEVRLETGRQHQVRAHLAHVGLPVVGDSVYGDVRPLARGLVARRLMLHAWRLAFRHPISGAQVAVTSPLPPDFSEILDGLRRRTGATRSV